MEKRSSFIPCSFSNESSKVLYGVNESSSSILRPFLSSLIPAVLFVSDTCRHLMPRRDFNQSMPAYLVGTNVNVAGSLSLIDTSSVTVTMPSKPFSYLEGKFER